MRSSDSRADDVTPGGAGADRPARRGRRGARGRGIVAAALALAAVLGAAPPGAAQPRTELPAGVDGPPRRHLGFPALPASVLDATRLTDVEVAGPRLRARLDGDPVSVVAGSPFVVVGDRVRQLPNPPYLREGRLWVPVRLLAAVGAAPRTAAGAARPAAERRGAWRVVLDPGHGGRDPGARGPGGTREKHAVLQIARKTKEALEDAEGIEVFLTRDSDEFLPLEERSRIAVRRDADLFVSIHANAARSRGARGFETYFLGEARTEEARRVAMRENASVQYQEDNRWSAEEQVEYILTSADQRLYAQESNYLAGHIQNRLRRRHPASDRGVKQAGFYVLMGATGSMPSVLVETGFISNPSSERFLASGEGQRRVARSIADAIESYFRERERRGAVRTARR